ncbi:MAG: protein kinase domain-containing protein [Caldimonas sp.]
MKFAAHDWPAISALLDEALELPPERRGRWLDELPDVSRSHRDALEQLLADRASVETLDFLQTLPKVGLSDEASAAALDDDVARTVGPYRLLREIGRGGMGSVWLAERVDGQIKRRVALKLPHPGLATRAFGERLMRERDILASLAHRHIARLYDAGVTANGQPYIALEYVEGETIVEACDAQRHGVRERIELFLQVLGAVQYAHSHLVIHRDLKPSNVLVDGEGQVRLLDFGVAKLLVDGLGEATELTLDAGAALTPDFASPEQIMGRPLGTASDVYSLGILLYQLLTGTRPYHLARRGKESLAQAIGGVDVPPPSAAAAKDERAAAARGVSPAQLARSLRGDLDTIVLKALKPAPEERYETAAAFQADLQRFLRGEPVLARPDRAGYRLRKFVARNRLAVAAGVVGVTAIAAAAVGYAIEARIAVAERDYARAVADRSDAISRFLNDLLVEAAQSQHPVSVDELLGRSEKLIAAGYRDNPEHRAVVLDTLGMYYLTTGNQAKAAELMKQALAAAAGSTDPALLDQLHCNRAFTVSKLGRVDEAKKELETVLDHEFRDPRVRVVCVLYRSFIAHDNNDRQGSLAYAQEALDVLHRQREALPELEAEVLGNLGTAYQDNGRPREADAYFASALQKYVELGRERGHVALTVRSNLATLRGDMGDPTAALALTDEILQIAQGDDPSSQPPLYLLVNRAHLLRAVGRYAEAVAAYEVANRAARRQDNPSASASTLLGMAGVAREQGDLATAQRRIDEAKAIVDARLPRGAPVLGRLTFEAAMLDLARAQPAPALAAFASLLDKPGPPAAVAAALIGRAESAMRLGQLDAALADARQANSLAESLQGGAPYSARVGAARLELGQVLKARGDAAGAAAAFKAAADHLSHTVAAAQWQRVMAGELLQAATPP